MSDTIVAVSKFSSKTWTIVKGLPSVSTLNVSRSPCVIKIDGFPISFKSNINSYSCLVSENSEITSNTNSDLSTNSNLLTIARLANKLLIFKLSVFPCLTVNVGFCVVDEKSSVVKLNEVTSSEKDTIQSYIPSSCPIVSINSVSNSYEFKSTIFKLLCVIGFKL